jgi:hypothetical protein
VMWLSLSDKAVGMRGGFSHSFFPDWSGVHSVFVFWGHTERVGFRWLHLPLGTLSSGKIEFILVFLGSFQCFICIYDWILYPLFSL